MKTRRTKQQLQQIFDDTLAEIQRYKHRNINGSINSKEVDEILDNIQVLRKLTKDGIGCSNRQNKGVFSKRGAFIGWG